VASSEARLSQWLVLGEDQQHQGFIYHWLRGRGVPRGKIRLLPLPAGKGAGEQYVRTQYAQQVADLRRRNYLALALVVVIDADLAPVKQRVDELDARSPRQPGERIALVIPRRNIETWIRFLTAPPVDEEADYKPRNPDFGDTRQAAKALAALSTPPADAPDSLRQFFVEAARILP
jgi:hypothetical protein